ncbi:hypothetical protein GCM10025868_25060 [Angustibacter aerolatus]|uniref:Uncharacterized protein n=1 Tax=Angustibacter aerolatus TaxID=1162965 RepID=A0ABQ6JI86_9ACTN|nr:hypothetical protein GCM10025868_25060 [Angustibacter aerolatus]
MSARTTSRSTSGPEPAACERTSDRCSLGPPLGRDVRRGEGAEAGRHAVVRLDVVGERLDHRPAAGHLGERRGVDAHPGPVARDRDDVVRPEGPVPTTTWRVVGSVLVMPSSAPPGRRARGCRRHLSV